MDKPPSSPAPSPATSPGPSRRRTCRSRRRRSPTNAWPRPRPAPRPVHIHVRDPQTGKPSMAARALPRRGGAHPRSSDRELIINLTTGPGGRFVPGEDDPQGRRPRHHAAAARAARRAHRRAAARHLLARPQHHELGRPGGDQHAAATCAAWRSVIRDAGVEARAGVLRHRRHRAWRWTLIDDGTLQGPGLCTLVLGVQLRLPADAGGACMYARSLLPPRRALDRVRHRPHGVPDRGAGLPAGRPRARRHGGQRSISTAACWREEQRRAGRQGAATSSKTSAARWRMRARRARCAAFAGSGAGRA